MSNASLAASGPWGEENYLYGLSGAATRTTRWRKVVLWTTGAYLMLNAGFMMVRFPPVGPGVPMGELVLTLTLCTLNLFVLLPRMAREVWLFPILTWWALALPRVIYDIPSGGGWAFRDASQEIESLYLIVGFWLVSKPEYLNYFFRWLRRLLPWLGLYGLCFPFADTLQQHVPHLPGMAEGTSRSILFQVIDTPEMMVWAAYWLLVDRQQRSRTLSIRNLWAGLLLAFAVGLCQEREIYMEVIILGAALLFLKKKFAGRWISILVFGAILIGFISVTGLQIKGRKDANVSLAYIGQHFMTIGGHAESEAVVGSANGVDDRERWWANILSQLESSPRKMTFGLGFGMPLTDLGINAAATVREPHDSTMSVLARLGVTGLIAWLLMQCALYYSMWRSYRLSLRLGWTEVQSNLLILFTYCLLLMVDAVGEDSFEKPFFAIPYYLFFGVVLRYGWYLKNAAAGSQVEMVAMEDAAEIGKLA